MKLTKIDIATSRMDEMLAFYSEVFGIHFQKITETINGKSWNLYLGEIDGIKFFLCPDEPSGTAKNQAGVHQFHIQMEDLDNLINTAKLKGIRIDEVPFGEGVKNYCLRDPDGHPWIISELN